MIFNSRSARCCSQAILRHDRTWHSLAPHSNALSRSIPKTKIFYPKTSYFQARRFSDLPRSAFCRLPSRRLVLLEGDDAAKYLQGLIAANVQSSSPFYTVFLNAAGRVLYDVFIYPIAGRSDGQGQGQGGLSDLLHGQADGRAGYLIEVDAEQVDSLMQHLRRFRLRAKIHIEALDPQSWTIAAAWGMDLPGLLENNARKSSTEIHAPDDRAPGGLMGYRILWPRSSQNADQPAVLEDQVEVDPEVYKVRRILNGIPEGQAEMVRETALPQESNVDYMRGIDFRKGCYVGQELTIRTHHTGVVRKRILPVQLYDPAIHTRPGDEIIHDPSISDFTPAAGSSIVKDDGKRGRNVGKFLTSTGNIGLALCRLEAMAGIDAAGHIAANSTWATDVFRIATEQNDDQADQRSVAVKAFVPEWHRSRAQEQAVR